MEHFSICDDISLQITTIIPYSISNLIYHTHRNYCSNFHYFSPSPLSFFYFYKLPVNYVSSLLSDFQFILFIIMVFFPVICTIYKMILIFYYPYILLTLHFILYFFKDGVVLWSLKLTPMSQMWGFRLI